MAFIERLVFLVLALGASSLFMGLHSVQEGHVGVYWLGGALLETVNEPGFHWMTPWVTSVANVQVTLQTDVVKDIPCGTSGGAIIHFARIEVVNRLDKKHAYTTVKNYGVDYDKTWIFDRIHHEINQFCSSHTLQEVYIDQFDTLDEALAAELQKSCDQWDTGIQIVSIRVTKPTIPRQVRENYEAIEKTKTEYLIQLEAEKVARKEEEIKRMRETVQAEKEAEIARINAEKLATISMIDAKKLIKEKEAEQTKCAIDDQISLNAKKAATDAAFYHKTKEAEANERLYTEAYLRYVLYTSLSNNTKIYFGEKIPTIFSDWMPLPTQPGAPPKATK
eukprot:TRINITY_DN497_c0_g1_i1.p1 TRINITY_DN497_c0_g1~~TRINITY_DN497_c0_g1_i1.p1  ORF type:complete len:350 (-),score=116.79 TRINITY_DN497_c0_g1_i1:44-1048(-)